MFRLGDDDIESPGFPAGFHLLGGGGELKDFGGGGGGSLGVGGLKIKSVKIWGGVTNFLGGSLPPKLACRKPWSPCKIFLDTFDFFLYKVVSVFVSLS